MSYIAFPRGDARAIADARAKGFKPAGAVEIILAGGWMDSPNPQVFADANQAYCWDWLKGLSVVLLVDSKTRLSNILPAIERAEPAQIDVIDRERRLGWLICSTQPRIKTVRWPPAWVADWLDGGTWHQELAQVKADAKTVAEARRKAIPIFEQEAIWN